MPTCHVVTCPNDPTVHVKIEYKGQTQEFDTCGEHYAFQRPTDATVTTSPIKKDNNES